MSAKRKAADSETQGDDVGAKKRKRDEQEKADSKLQEYLQVMGKSSANPIADVTASVDDPGSSAMPNVAVPEGESDDEYETIPTAKEKQQRKVAKPEKEPPADIVMGDSQDLANTHGDTEKAREDPVPDSGEASHSESQAQPTDAGATDDDWLRSRTNRLLDLVDPDDLPSSGTHEAKGLTTDSDESQQPPNQTSEGQAEVATKEPEEVASGAKEEDPVDTIRRTSRLFVRNLPYTASEDNIRESFEKFGTVEEVC